MRAIPIEKRLFIIGKYISIALVVMITPLSFVPHDSEIYKAIDFIAIPTLYIFSVYIPVAFAILLYFILKRRGIISKKDRDILILHTKSNNKERLYLALVGFAFIALPLLIILYDTSYVFFPFIYPYFSSLGLLIILVGVFSFAETITVNKGIITFDQRDESLPSNELEFVEIDKQSFKAVTPLVEHEFDFNNKQSKILHFWWSQNIKTINTKPS
ncbi:MAG: hypothetical protein ACI81T_001293 [Bacteroidia bacterium]